MVMSFTEELALDRWRGATSARRRELAEAVSAAHPTLKVIRVDEIARFHHEPTGLPFHLVPGGALRMGVDADEVGRLRAQYQYWDGADEAEHTLSVLSSRTCWPVTEVSIRPFLLAAHPVGRTPVRSYEELAAMGAAEWIAHLERFEAEGMSLEQALDEERRLGEVGLRLPSEAEWEWAARGAGSQSFPGGDAIPSSPNTGVNLLGFVDLGALPEVCADAWAPTLEGTRRDGAPRAGEPSAGRAARGGGATCYPWQDCGEWTLLLSGARFPAREMDGMLALRPAMGLS